MNPSGNNSEALAQVLALEEDRRLATIGADVERLAELMAADCIYVHAVGLVDRRDSYLTRLASGKIRYLKIENSVADSVSRIGTIVLTYESRISVLVNSKEQSLRNRTTVAWAQEHDEWRLLVLQATALADDTHMPARAVQPK